MTLIEMMMKRGPVWQGVGAGTGGAGAGGEGGAGAGGAGDDAGGGAGEGGAGGSGEGGDGKAWWEADEYSAEERDWLTAKGLATDDPKEALTKALRGYRNGEQKLGKPAEELMSRPAKDQDVKDWMKENREMFGLPEKIEDYDLKRPDMPDGMEYDTALEGEIKTIAFEEGVPPATVERMVAKYAEHMAATMTGVEDDLAAAKTEMMADLQKEWGDQTAAKMAQARQGMSAIAEAAGFDQAAIAALAGAMKDKVGDAAIIRLGAAVAEMMGEDQLKGLGQGNRSLSTTPAEARQRLAAMNAPDGEYGKAVHDGNQAKIRELRPERERLYKLASGG